MSDHRIFPHSPQAEKGLLSCALLYPAEVISHLREIGASVDWFHLPAHAEIYRAIMAMDDAKKSIDLILLTQHLRDGGKLEIAGGAAGVTSVAISEATFGFYANYAIEVKNKWLLRNLIITCTEFAERAYVDHSDADGMLSEFEQKALAIKGDSCTEIKERSTKELVMESLYEMETSYENKGKLNGLSTGFSELDQMLDGLHESELILIAARPSMGKTAIGANIAVHVVTTEKKTVAFFTAEMSDKQIIRRMILSTAKVDAHRLRSGMMQESDFPRITVAASKLAESKLRVFDVNGATIQKIQAKARRLKRTNPDLCLIVIDYLQYIRSSSKQAQGSREREVAEISAGCKGIAKELGIPIIVLAQLNRDVEKRGGDSRGRPRMSDLRESGAIEQDSDVVGLLYREEYYAENEQERQDLAGKAVLIIAKQRNGPVGDVPLTFLKEFTTFENRAREYQND